MLVLEIEHVLGLPAEDILRTSAKTGRGARAARRDHRPHPPPQGDPEAPLLLDLLLLRPDPRRREGSLRIVDGMLHSGARLRFMQANVVHDIEEVGVRNADRVPPAAGPGEVGYSIAGIKDVGEARSGETVTTAQHGATHALASHWDPKPMVFCGLYPVDGRRPARRAREAKLNDASLHLPAGVLRRPGHRLPLLFRPSTWRSARERLEREFDLSLIATAPSVAYPGSPTAASSTSTTRPSCPTPAASTRSP